MIQAEDRRGLALLREEVHANPPEPEARRLPDVCVFGEMEVVDEGPQLSCEPNRPQHAAHVVLLLSRARLASCRASRSTAESQGGSLHGEVTTQSPAGKAAPPAARGAEPRRGARAHSHRLAPSLRPAEMPRQAGARPHHRVDRAGSQTMSASRRCGACVKR